MPFALERPVTPTVTDPSPAEGGAATGGVTPDAALLERVRAAYGASRFVDAWALAGAAGDPLAWRGTVARVLAGRLARHLGAPRRGLAMLLRAGRADPADPEARYFACYALLEVRGPLAAWRAVRRARADGHPVDGTADWLGLQGAVHAALGDLDRALALSARALEADGADAWTLVERAHVLERADRREEALALAREAARGPGGGHRAGVQLEASLLAAFDRLDEALAVLEPATRALQSWAVACQRAALLGLRERHAEARAAWEASVALAPLLPLEEEGDEAAAERRPADPAAAAQAGAARRSGERGAAAWFAGVRADAAYDAGDVAAALALARRAGPFHRAVALRVAAAPPGARRVTLPVPYVRQHRDTCAPTSFAMLCAFWGRPVDHLALADAITYDGTPGHAERAWAEASGWVVRELTLDWTTATALLDRGVPFCLDLVAPESAHQIAVCGYDDRRGVLLARDPSSPGQTELLFEPVAARHAAWGPKALVAVPAARAALLEGVALPQAPLHDLLFAVDRALLRHDRDAAEAALARLSDLAPEAPPTRFAALALARYDADPARAAAVLEAAVARHPADEVLRLTHAQALLGAQRPDAARAALEAALEVLPAPHPALWRLLALVLGDDAREDAVALRLLARCRRHMPDDAALVSLEADRRWAAPGGPDDEALALRRFAATLADKHEGRARTYALAARALERGPEALAWLEGRAERHGARSAAPVCTLAWAHELLGDLGRARAVLEAAHAARPDDPDLLLALAELAARTGDAAGAADLLERARPETSEEARALPPAPAGGAGAAPGAGGPTASPAAGGPAPGAWRSVATPGAWRRAAARVAAWSGEAALALARWREVLAREPLDVEAQEAAAGLLLELEGEGAAIAHLRAAAAAHPRHVELQRLVCGWLGRHDEAAAIEALRAARAAGIVDAWIERELALDLMRTGAHDDALVHADLALEIEPSAVSHAIRGEVLQRAGRRAEGDAALRACLARTLDHPPAVFLLVAGAPDEAAREALDWLHGELGRRPCGEAAAGAWVDAARGRLEPEALVERVRALCAARPERWFHRRDLVELLLRAGRPEEARREAAAACARIPLQAELWLAHAQALATLPEGARVPALERGAEADAAAGPAGDVDAREARRAALERALALAPLDLDAVRALVRDDLAAGRVEPAEQLARRLVAQRPLDPNAQVLLGEALERRGEPDGALRRFERAVRLAPTSGVAWSTLRRAAERLERAGRVEDLARALAAQRPRDPVPWLQLAAALHPARLEERLAALGAALERAPRDVEARDLRATLLGEAGRWDEAEAACGPAAGEERAPLELRGRAAWLRAQRGDLPAAIAAMAPLVAEAPDYLWGARHLAEWAYEARDPEAVRHAERWIALAPDDPVAWTHRGMGHLRAGRRAEARADLLRACEVEPGYDFAPRRLFDLALEDRDWAAAERALGPLAAATDAGALAARARLAAGRAEAGARADVRARRDAALAALEALARHAAPGPDLDAALAAIERAGWAPRAAQVLDEALLAAAGPGGAADGGRGAATAVEVGEAWGRLADGLVPAPDEARVARLLGAGPAGVAAAGAWIERLADLGRRRDVERLVRRAEGALRAHDRTWGAVGYAWIQFDRARACADWHADWQERADPPTWALGNHAQALRCLGRDDEARAVTEALVARGQARGDLTHQHWAWHAFDRALAGDPGVALGLDRGAGKEYSQAVAHLAWAAGAAASRAPLAEVDAALAAARRVVPGWRKNAALVRAMAEVVRAAAAGRGAAGLWWGLGTRLGAATWDPALVVFVLALLATALFARLTVGR